MTVATSSSRRRQRQLDAEALTVPEVPWPRLYEHLRRTWQPDEHVTLLGPTRAGKTHAALELTRMTPYTLVIATKRRDPLVESLRGRYFVVDDLSEIPVSADTGRPVHRKVLLWTNPRAKTEAARWAVQARVIRQAFKIAEEQGSWTIVLDETMWLAQNLRLATELDSLWFQAASSRVSLVALAQRPSKIPRMMVSQATMLFLWQFSDRRDLEVLREFGGSQDVRAVIEENLPRLSWQRHEFLWVNVRTGEMARSVAPAR